MRHDRNEFAIACSDRVTPIVAATDVASYVVPWDFTLVDLQAQLLDAAASGTFTIDVNVAAVSILSVKLTIDAGETSSLTAATAFEFTPVTATTARGKEIFIAKGSKVSIDVDDDAAGDALGLIVTFLGWSHR